MVKAVAPNGEKAGVHVGIAIRSSGLSNISTAGGTVQEISFKHCRRLHQAYGYHYERREARTAA